MKKKVLSNSQLQRVIDLREKKLSWVRIEEETGIARRIAKRDYDEWFAKQSQRQLEEARKEVVAQEYRMHLDLLSRMANFLLDSLVIPHPLTDIRRSDEVMAQFLARDFYREEPSFGPRLGDQQRDKRVIHMNELLFKSLRDHTQRKVTWQVLDVWKETRDDCVEDIAKMRKEIQEVLGNILDQELEIKKKLDNVYRDSSVAEDIIRGVLIYMWLVAVIGMNGKVTTMKGASLTTRGTAWVVFHDNAPADTSVIFDRESPGDNEFLAREVSRVCRWAIENLLELKSDLIENMKAEVNMMKENASKLEAVLNPLVLRPIILNTQCNICPI